jgi:hypothetical protein
MLYTVDTGSRGILESEYCHRYLQRYRLTRNTHLQKRYRAQARSSAIGMSGPLTIQRSNQFLSRRSSTFGSFGNESFQLERTTLRRMAVILCNRQRPNNHAVLNCDAISFENRSDRCVPASGPLIRGRKNSVRVICVVLFTAKKEHTIHSLSSGGCPRKTSWTAAASGRSTKT